LAWPLRSSLYFTLIAETGTARASVITYVNPAVAVGLGVVVPRREADNHHGRRIRADSRRLDLRDQGSAPTAGRIAIIE
jgi:hypothetical protein